MQRGKKLCVSVSLRQISFSVGAEYAEERLTGVVAQGRVTEKRMNMRGYIAAGLLLFVGTGLRAQDFDIVIANGRVMDPATNLDAVRHIGVRAGKIAAVSAMPLRGRAASRYSSRRSSPAHCSISGSTASSGQFASVRSDPPKPANS